MGIRAVRLATSCGQPYEEAGFITGSAQWGHDRRSGNWAANEVSSLEQPVRWSECRCFGQLEQRRSLQSMGGPVQRGLLHRSGNWAVWWLCCSSAPCGWAASSLGKPGGGVSSFVREPRAVRLAPARRATGTTVSASWCGRPAHAVDFVALGNWGGGVGFSVRATRAVGSGRSRGQPRGRTGFMASGSMNGARFIVWETGW